MNRYTKVEIQKINNELNQEYYLPEVVFGVHKLDAVSIEVKFAYGAMLNVLLKAPNYTKNGDAYIKIDNPEIVNTLNKLTNKDVDNEKIEKYIKILNDLDFVDVAKQNLFVKKVD